MAITLQKWSKIRQDYLTSDKSVIQIAKDHKVSQSAIKLKAKTEGWTRTVTRRDLILRAQQAPRKLRATTDTQKAAFGMLIDQGLPVHRAANALGITSATAHRLSKRPNSYEKNRSKLVKKSVIVAECALSGSRLGGDPVIDPETGQQALDPDTGKPLFKGGITFKGADVAKIAMNIIDKENPTVKVSVNASVEFMPINLDDYK
jgi:hypothetical protein